MVESVDKRDDRDGRAASVEPLGPVKEAAATRADDTFADTNEKKTIVLDTDGKGDAEARRVISQDGSNPVSERDRGLHDLSVPLAAPLAGPTVTPAAPVPTPNVAPRTMQEMDQTAFGRDPAHGDAAGAQVIPFVPRGGLMRPTPLPAQAELRFARPATGSAAFAGSADAPFSLPPAQPPPPSGFRRAPGWVRGDGEPAQPLPPEASVTGGSDGSFVGLLQSRLRAVWIRFASNWTWRRGLKVAVLGFAALVLAYAVLVAVLAVAYRWVNPPTSSLMLAQRIAGTGIAQTWVPIERISPHLLQAVILSEDGQFCRHRGVDWLAMKEAIEQSLDGSARGGSTISMQTVKNLFLWPSKSYLRKAIELPLAMGSEMVWSKQRMLEIYLNIAEWGPGVFGAEAAARYHFGRSASGLSAREASLLAVSLPNPLDRQAGQPSAGQQRLAERLQARMRRVPNAAACAMAGRGNRAS